MIRALQTSERAVDDNDDTAQVIYENLDDSMMSLDSTAVSEGGRPVRKTAKQYKIERSKQKYRRKNRTSSEISDDAEMSQVTFENLNIVV